MKPPLHQAALDAYLRGELGPRGYPNRAQRRRGDRLSGVSTPRLILPPGVRQQPAKVVVGLPLYHQVPVEWHLASAEFMRGCVGRIPVQHHNAVTAVNLIIKEALRLLGAAPKAWDWLLIIDQDMILPPDVCLRANLYPPGCIVGPLSFYRSAQSPLCIPARLDAERGVTLRYSEDEVRELHDADCLMEVGVVGAGGMFIHRDVLTGWNPDHPAFRGENHRLCPGHWPPMQTHRPVAAEDPYESYTHDVWFCWHAALQGFRTLVDPGIETIHVATFGVDYAWHMEWRRQLGLRNQKDAEVSNPDVPHKEEERPPT